jgi:hypothetical protein
MLKAFRKHVEHGPCVYSEITGHGSQLIDPQRLISAYNLNFID